MSHAKSHRGFTTADCLTARPRPSRRGAGGAQRPKPDRVNLNRELFAPPSPPRYTFEDPMTNSAQLIRNITSAKE